MQKIAFKPALVLGAVALASGLACAQTPRGPTPAIAAVPAPAVSTVQLYGIVDVAYRRTDNEGPGADRSLNKMIGGGMSQSRWGVNVTEDLGGGLRAIANLENRLNADDGTVTTPFFQQSWVGLQGGFGRLTMGRQYNMLFDLVTSTYASFPYSPYMDAYKPEIGMAMGARASNMIKYLAEVGAWRASLQYSFDENNEVNATTTPGAIPGIVGGATKTAGGYVRYAANGIAAGAGFLRTSLPGGTDVDAWTLGGSYRTGPWYLNAGYALNKRDAYSANPLAAAADRALLGAYWTGSSNGGFVPGDADKRQMVKLGFGYQLTPQLNLGAHFFHAKQSGSVKNTNNGKANFIVAVADYAFSKRTDAYFGVDHTKVSGNAGNVLDGTNGARDRTGITIGMRHRF